MKLKTVLSLFVFLALALQAPTASGQYIPRPRSSQMGAQATAGQHYEGNPDGLGLAFVTYLNGESLFMSADATEWDALTPNLSLLIGDRIWAQDDARIEIRFPLGATAWVNYQSELDVTRMERGSRADAIQLALVSGEAAFDLKSFERPGSVFQVDIPNASIRASRAARFRVNTLPDGTAQIGVISGSLVLETPDGLTDVSAGRMAEVQPDRRIFMDFLPAGDEWDHWVGSRAQIYDRPAVSRRHLPADLSSYAHEFDTSGRWVTDRTYGSVWVPAVERGWSPYSNGRWVWQANDYVWLSFDPWYAPFHYGRWSWGASIGWFWIAPRGKAYWSPGYVGWSVVGDEVSWVPLGHNEVYYGYGNHGPASVNIVGLLSFNVTNVYVNARVNNGIVVVKRDNFLRGKIVHERIAPSRNPFEGRAGDGSKIIGRPPVQEIRPIQATRQPRPEIEIKRSSLPPTRLGNASRSIRERVVAPTKATSAFGTGSAPRPHRNIQKEKELEQWTPPRKAPAPASGGAQAPAARLKKNEAPGQAPPPAAQSRHGEQPAGKRQFKRVTEPQGGASAAPAPNLVHEEKQRDEKKDEKKDEKDEKASGGGRNKGNERGSGKGN